MPKDAQYQYDYGFPFVYYTSLHAPIGDENYGEWTYTANLFMFIVDFIIWIFASYVILYMAKKIKKWVLK